VKHGKVAANSPTHPMMKPRGPKKKLSAKLQVVDLPTSIS
jgi:hypothetical protein